MWLQNLLLLGIVVCSFSAPNRPPTPVTPTQQQYEAAVKEALSILKQSNDTTAVLNETVDIVSGMYDKEEPTCLQTRLEIYQRGLRGSLIKLKGPLSLIASYFKQQCPLVPETSCAIQKITFDKFKANLSCFLYEIDFECENPI